MGWMIATSECFACHRIFSYNPERVPSIISPKTGTKEPICLACVERANPIRIKNGLEPIRPLPGAYEAEECV